MKRFLALTLSLVMALSLCACKESSETTETEILETGWVEDLEEETEETEETTRETTRATTRATAATTTETTEESFPDGLDADGGAPNPSNDDIDGVIHAATEACTVCRENKFFVYPVIDLESSDADAINSVISEKVTEMTTDEGEFYLSSDFFYYIYGDAISVVFIVEGDWDMNEYYIWNLSMENGNVISNDQIFAMSNAAEDTIAEAGTAACTNYLNHISSWGGNDEMLIVDGALNPNGPMYSANLEELFVNTFSIYNINDGMTMGIDSEGTLFFTSSVMSFGGADYYNQLYNYDGIDLYDMYCLTN